jgi:hypothetical protein
VFGGPIRVWTTGGVGSVAIDAIAAPPTSKLVRATSNHLALSSSVGGVTQTVVCVHCCLAGRSGRSARSGHPCQGKRHHDG